MNSIPNRQWHPTRECACGDCWKIDRQCPRLLEYAQMVERAKGTNLSVIRPKTVTLWASRGRE